VGLPGAFFDVYLRAPRECSAPAPAEESSLVVLMLGGNDAYDRPRRQTLDKVRNSARKLVERIQKAALPHRACSCRRWTV
jgi:lysophospholipase L1-like esterase